MSYNIYYKQLDNRNYMSPIGFQFSIARYPFNIEIA